MKPTNTAKIVNELMNARTVNGKPMTVSKLAKLSDIPQSTLARGLNKPYRTLRNSTLQKLANFFKVSIEVLQGKSPLPPAPQSSVNEVILEKAFTAAEKLRSELNPNMRPKEFVHLMATLYQSIGVESVTDENASK